MQSLLLRWSVSYLVEKGSSTIDATQLFSYFAVALAHHLSP